MCVLTIYIFTFIKQVHSFQKSTIFNLSKDYSFQFIKISAYKVSYAAVSNTFFLRSTMKLVGTLRPA